MVSELMQPILLEASDSIARLRLQPCEGKDCDGKDCDGKDIVEITGYLNGPHCDGRRTLAATFPLQAQSSEASGHGSVEILVTEPCYWMPSQPFSYHLDVTIRRSDGSVSEFCTPIGLRRLSTQGQSLLLERRRTVFRGVRVREIRSELLADARQAELVLLGGDSEEDVYEQASRLGVGLIVDLRGAKLDIARRIAQLDWYPAVLVVLLDAKQLQTVSSPASGPRGLLIALCITATTEAPVAVPESVDLFAIELDAGERPPDWVPQCDKPTIALRSDAAGEGISTARSHCDRLQAELAPQCNLAGYFV